VFGPAVMLKLTVAFPIGAPVAFITVTVTL
jgi:hypothetical protein